MSDTEDLFNGSSRSIQRNLSTQSYGEEEESQNLLDGHHVGDDRDAVHSHGGEGQKSNTLMRGVKRSVDLLLTEVKRLKEQNVSMEKKLNTVLHKNDNLEKLVKELASKNNKDVDQLEALLSADGLKMIKMMCFRNLDSYANDKNEVELLNKFMNKAKDEGWLLKMSGKAEKDIKQQFRLKRNYLKAQVRARVLEDMANKTPQEATDLPRSEKFIREHLGTSELSNDCLRILYNFSYTHLKYMNKKVKLSQEDGEVAKVARADPWVYVMQRVFADREAGRDHDIIKGRFAALLEKCNGFEPAPKQ